MYFYSGLVALVVSLGSFGATQYLVKDKGKITIEHINKVPSSSAVLTLDDNNKVVPVDFTATAEDVVDAVVHIKATHIYSQLQSNRFYPDEQVSDLFREFFGPRFRLGQPDHQMENPTRIGAGSGVIISEDGYIVTNNHVIADADDIEVTLHDNRTYKAAVIGVDPSTDLALIRIKEDGLPKVSFINSDEVKIGEWVLAVGNPFSLNSTITAGIVSAKGRNINILKDRYAVENFIQTDAAINPGNSGGALVNLDGGLVGINTAIASPTGAYSGYGFAVPSNIVSKVIEDLITYGVVQRGVLGVMIRTVDGNLAMQKELDVVKGVYVDSLLDQSAARNAGVERGDVILRVEDNDVNSASELQGAIAQYRPGEKIRLTINRLGEQMTKDVVLANRSGDTKLVTKESHEIAKVLGIELEELSEAEKKKLDIDYGVRIAKIYPGKVRKQTQMRDGFIVTKVDGRIIKSKEELLDHLEDVDGGVMLEGVYSDIPGEYFYAFGL